MTTRPPYKQPKANCLCGMNLLAYRGRPERLFSTPRGLAPNLSTSRTRVVLLSRKCLDQTKDPHRLVHLRRINDPLLPFIRSRTHCKVP